MALPMPCTTLLESRVSGRGESRSTYELSGRPDRACPLQRMVNERSPNFGAYVAEQTPIDFCQTIISVNPPWATSPRGDMHEMSCPAHFGEAQMNETMHTNTADHTGMQSCIDACGHCHATCLHTAMVHCLETGGKHLEANHFRLMMNCAELCQTSTNFMLSGSAFHVNLCAICADVCEACAKSCEAVGGMDECAKACRECALSCRKMSAKK